MADKTKLKTQEQVADEIDEAELEDEAEDDDGSRALTPAKGRPTPSRREREAAEEEKGGLVTRLVRGTRGYLEGVRSELAKVAWPTREDTRRLTQIVIVALVVSSLVLGAISLAFTRLFAVGLSSPLVLLIVMAIGVGIGLWWNRYSRRSSNL
jgi:preprotein translocase SecE subunit